MIKRDDLAWIWLVVALFLGFIIGMVTDNLVYSGLLC